MQTGKYQSGQMGQTVNLLAYAFGGSNPSLPTAKEQCGSSSVDRALAFQAEGRGFESRLPLSGESGKHLQMLPDSFFILLSKKFQADKMAFIPAHSSISITKS